MMSWKNIHPGETCLLVGNGENLHLTPPGLFDFPSFGMNTIHKYENWMPDYYVAVDWRVMHEFGKEIAEKYKDIPKFVTTDLRDWRGENFYPFLHLPASLRDGWRPELLGTGITYHSVMHVAMQLAYWMGFTTLLMIGVKHEPKKGAVHFWGTDAGMPDVLPTQDWLDGYKVLVDGMTERGVKVLNISVETFVPENIIPRDDWRKYAKS